MSGEFETAAEPGPTFDHLRGAPQTRTCSAVGRSVLVGGHAVDITASFELVREDPDTRSLVWAIDSTAAAGLAEVRIDERGNGSVALVDLELDPRGPLAGHTQPMLADVLQRALAHVGEAVDAALRGDDGNAQDGHPAELDPDRETSLPSPRGRWAVAVATFGLGLVVGAVAARRA